MWDVVENWLRRNCFAPGNGYPFLVSLYSGLKCVKVGTKSIKNCGTVNFAIL
jgi:hypothetical protein